MSQILEQQLSAFLDGELPAAELDLLLARLDRDPAQRATLARYAMIGECVRSGGATPVALGIAERVRTALLTDAQAGAQTVRPLPSAWGGWLAGGVAAAIAIVAVMLAGPDLGSVRKPQEVQQNSVTLRLMDEPLTAITAPANHRLSPRAAARLTSYLVAHGQYASQLSRSTFDSHLVTARAERASWRQAQDPAGVE
jgi:negative regulator of sigma E activity